MIDGQWSGADEISVSVRVGDRDGLRCQIARGSRLVFDNDPLPELFGQLIGQGARDDIRWPAGTKPQDKSYRPVGKLRPRVARQQGIQRERKGGRNLQS